LFYTIPSIFTDTMADTGEKQSTLSKPATFSELYRLNWLMYDSRNIAEPHAICSEPHVKLQLHVKPHEQHYRLRVATKTQQNESRRIWKFPDRAQYW